MPESKISKETILIRHGQSTANASGVWQGKLDFPLSDLGREQARTAGEALSEECLDAFYSSPLSRAFETAEIIAREAGFTDDITPMDGLIERGGGAFEGNTWPERERDMPDLIAKFRSVPEEEGWSVVGAETDEEILARFTPAISEILARHPPGSRIVIVAHGGVMRAFLRNLFGGNILSGGERAENASITRVEWLEKGDGGDKPRLTELAATDHLPEAESPPTRGPTSE
ncbi:MAG: histidine phosphatase family protein [Rubrobacteraceae bacterium]|jgi:probable phosphoglycerate mutase|nr:histidine phosphatase family protein [Rubrobacter sp.]